MENSSVFNKKGCSCIFCFCTDTYFIQYRKNISGPKSIYKCRACKRRFTPNDGFKKFRYSPVVIKSALDLLKRGASLGKVVNYLNHSFRLRVTRKTIFDWKKKFL